MKAFTTSMAKMLRLTRGGDPLAATKSLQKLLATSGLGVPFDMKAPGGIANIAPSPRNDASKSSSNYASHIGGSVTERHYTNCAGSLGYRLYLPVNHCPAMPLVIMLHGCTQSPEDFAIGTAMDQLADELVFMVAYPRQTASGNAQKCWNWFRPDDQKRDRGEPSLIAGLTREILADHKGDPARVYVAGLSAGGAAAAILADQYPDLFAAVGIHSGLACGAAHDLPSALSAMKAGSPRKKREASRSFVPTITFHGDGDKTVSASNSAEIIAAATSASVTPLTTQRDSGQQGDGRRYTRVISTDSTGTAMLESWTVHGSGHAWSGGHVSGSYTDPRGPDASREMMRFFLSHKLAAHPVKPD